MRVTALFVSLCFILTGTVFAAETDDADRLLQEARKLYENADKPADIMEALEKSNQALDMYTKAHRLDDEAAANLLTGMLCLETGEGDKAQSHLDKALQRNQLSGDRKGQALCLTSLGRIQTGRNDEEKALEYHQRALAALRRVDDPAAEHKVYDNIAAVYVRLKRYPDAVEYYKRSLAGYLKHGDLRRQGDALYLLGDTYARNGEYHKAIEYFEQSRAVQARRGIPESEKIAVRALALTAEAMGDHDRAIEYFRQMGDPVLRFKDTESVGQVYFDIGSSNLIGGNYAEARRTFEELLLMKKTDNPMAESAALSYIALANMLEGNWNRAITEFEKAVELREKLRQPTHNLEYLIALCRAAKGEGDKAVPLLTKVGGAEASARLALVEGRLEKAVQLFQKAASDAEERKNSLIMISALTGLGEAYEKMGDKAKAAEAYTKAVDLLQGPDFVSPFDRRDRMIRLLFAGFAPGAPKAALERLKN